MDDITKAKLEWCEIFDKAMFERYVAIIYLVASHFEGKRTKAEVFDEIKKIVSVPPVLRN